ncbi:hypothetical protein [Staphylococcus sp. EZ-P03]|uniref:hypothetical protein n=1 Tax=Staphylococcus sp. EZ-P03 TaxID=2282739 RepID=UPI001F08D30C|nr:hypothetical protein [Staphylococcus sp. EZ-P03]
MKSAPEPFHLISSNIDIITHANSKNKNVLVTHAYGKDKRGFINSTNVELLYDELVLADFNEKAKTVDGMPLAIGNGKIISNPNFSNKNNLYTLGQCTYYVFDKRVQDGNLISTLWGGCEKLGQPSQSCWI